MQEKPRLFFVSSINQADTTRVRCRESTGQQMTQKPHGMKRQIKIEQHPQYFSVLVTTVVLFPPPPPLLLLLLLLFMTTMLLRFGAAGATGCG